MKELTTAYFVLLGVLVLLIMLLISSSSNRLGYSSGYCSALGGERIGLSATCNVDGRVVVVE